jgi:hypothetical protein
MPVCGFDSPQKKEYKAMCGNGRSDYLSSNDLITVILVFLPQR